MFKFWNKMKENKKNKGFTLVELIIVVAILAILVGLLAPQYVKYVEKSRRAADASNLDNIVNAFKVASADTDFDIDPDTYIITINQKDGAKITKTKTDSTGDWAKAIEEYTGYDFSSNAVASIKLKSNQWKTDNSFSVTGDAPIIAAQVTVAESGAVDVVYNPATLKDQENKATPTPVQNPPAGGGQ